MSDNYLLTSGDTVYDHFQLDWDSACGREFPIGRYEDKETALAAIGSAREALRKWGWSAEEIDAGEFFAFYNGPDLTISNVSVSMEGVGDHEYRMINFEAHDVTYAEYLDDDGSLCVSSESNLDHSTGLSDYQADRIRDQLQNWLEANPQPDLTDEAAPRPAA